MGWLFSSAWPTKKDLIRERVAPHSWTRDDGTTVTIETLKHTVTGTNLWKVQRRTIDSVETDRYVALDLIGTHGGYGWGYKDLDESVGPAEINCPLSYLEGLPEPINDYAREWRESVRSFHAERAKRLAYQKSLKEGDIVTIYGHQYTVVDVMARGLLHVRGGEYNQTFRARAKQLTLKED